MFEIRRIGPSSRRSPSLYLFIRRAIKQTVVVTIETYQFCPPLKNFIGHYSIKAFFIFTKNYWGTSVSILYV